MLVACATVAQLQAASAGPYTIGMRNHQLFDSLHVRSHNKCHTLLSSKIEHVVMR